MASRLQLATQLVPLIFWLSAVDSVEAKQLSFYRDSTGLHYLWQVDATPKRDLTLNVPNESALPLGKHGGLIKPTLLSFNN